MDLVVVIAFLGFLALIGFVMYRLLEAGAAFWKARRDGGGIKCPECRGNVVRGATRCKNCGVVLTTASEPRVEPKAVPPPAPKSDQERHRQMLEQFHSQRRGEK